MPKSPPATTPLRDLDERSREIFRRIVESYLETGEPVGSRNISKILPMALSPASVRNVMQDLEEAGLIYAPHVSAGRKPTETGLRFFVDALMEIGDLTADERGRIDAEVRASGRALNADQVLTEASQLLSGLSRGAGVVLSTKSDHLRLKHVEFVRLEPRKGLVVLVGEDGSVENRLIDLVPEMPSSSLSEAANFLNSQMRGRTLSEARQAMQARHQEFERELDELTKRVVDTGLATWAGAEAGRPRQLIVRGRANLLDDLKAAEDLERIRVLFDDLERNRDLVQLLGHAETGDGVRIFIGTENKLFSLSGSSLVVSPFRDKDQRVIGILGVIGPTRLNYARVIPMVDYTAKVVSKILG